MPGRMEDTQPSRVEATMSTLETAFILSTPRPTTEVEVSEITNVSKESQSTAETTRRDKGSPRPKVKPTSTTRTAPYSALPFHRPLKTGDDWGKHLGKVGSALVLNEALAVHNPMGETDFIRVAKVYSGVYTFLLCVATVIVCVLLRWMWNGCYIGDDDNYVVRKGRLIRRKMRWWC